ncbi:hypothetical protein HPB52_021973 [Rhipicephalus sanguineus]|uniref:GST N-terminal domain-containing protein n=1 Tax=Rhipicephalus sanguineus TaxID=34632 RepID=A0A9D4STH5_RHISA|nr:hypothetical protein HPB52_021973 [Rhipicephalus sanguineus]
MAALVLGYWDIRGLAEPIRYLLAHAGVPYEDKRYGFGDGPEPTRDEWLAVKYKLDLDFPNLPYIIDGDVRMTQSQAILRYLGRKHGLAPKDEETVRRVEMLEHQEFEAVLALDNIWLQKFIFEALEYHLPRDLKCRLTYFSWRPCQYDEL